MSENIFKAIKEELYKLNNDDERLLLLTEIFIFTEDMREIIANNNEEKEIG